MQSKFIGRFDNSLLEDMEEFRKRYENTYLFITMNKIRLLYYVKEVKADYILVYNSSVGTLELDRDTEIELEVAWPEQGLFNFNNGLYWACRIPDRQWRRAISTKNILLSGVVDNFYDLAPPKVNEDSLIAAFETPVYTSLKQACNQLATTDSWGVALNRKWGVTHTPSPKVTKSFILWRGKRVVGTIKLSSKTIDVRFPHLFQEVRDLNRYKENSLWQLNCVS